jgi:branched-chain amino acid transport system substrate-binding protein
MRAALLAALSLALAGCGGSDSDRQEGGETLTVYVSAPLHGERAGEGRAIENGAKLALADARGRVGGLDIIGVYLDDSRGAGWSLVRTADNARQAAEDVTAIGYIGDLDSGATRASLPITNQAEMVQISPGSTAVDLTRTPEAGNLDPERLQPSDTRTFARIVPADDVQARAAALLAKRIGARTVDYVTDGSQFGAVLAKAFSTEAARLGLGAGEGTGVDAVYYAGGPAGLAKAIRGLPPRPLIASDAVQVEGLRICGSLRGPLYVTSPFRSPHELVPRAKAFNRAYRARYGQAPATAAYGYEAMALLLDAIRRAGDGGDNRSEVIDEVLATRDRDSIIGRYSIDGNGDTTLDLVTVLALRDCRLSFDRELRAPR